MMEQSIEINNNEITKRKKVDQKEQLHTLKKKLKKEQGKEQDYIIH